MIKIDELISRCCKATVRIGSAEEIEGKRVINPNNYICCHCGNLCYVTEREDEKRLEEELRKRVTKVYCKDCGKDLGEETTVKNSDGNLKVEVGACQHCQMLMNNRQLGKTHYRIIERFAKDMGYDCKPVIREDSISNI